MSVMRIVRASTFALLLGGCALFGGGGPSTVAQGKYYSSGNPQYDQYFIQLYDLQVQLEAAPQVPPTERQNLAQILGLSPETPVEGIAQRLREEAVKLSRSGVHMRLEQNTPADKPEAASAAIHATVRPKDAALAWIERVETSATNLLRAEQAMKADSAALAKLDVDTVNLDADVPKAFAEAHVGKQSEVKKNLADAQKLIALMRARSAEVQSECDELITSIAKAVNTDDGSLNAPPPEAAAEPKEDSKKPAPKRAAARPGNAAAPAKPAAPPPAKPKPAAKPSGSDEDAPAKPAAPTKPAPAPRDFEP